MKIFTFMSLDEIAEYSDPKRNINEAKEKLAYEVTKIIHGEAEAAKALSAAKALFSTGGDMSNVPATEVKRSEWPEEGMGVLTMFTLAKITASNGEARRIVTQGGAEVNGVKITDPKTAFRASDANSDGAFLLKSGKKRFAKIVLV